MKISEGPFSMDDGTSMLSMREPVEGDNEVKWMVYDDSDFARPTTYTASGVEKTSE